MTISSPNDIQDYKSSVYALMNKSSTREQVVNAITQWMNVVEDDFEGLPMDYAVSRRTLWVFPNGITLIVSPRFGPHISNLHGLVPEDSPAPVPEEDQHNWNTAMYVNGWRLSLDPFVFRGPQFICHAIDSLTKINGEPSLVIPWMDSWARDSLDDEADFFEHEEQAERRTLRESVQQMFKFVAEGKLDSASPWPVEISAREAYMSEFCGYMEFKRFLDELEERKMALVARNEWTDFMNSDREAKIRSERPEFGESPIVWVPLNYGAKAYHPSGWVFDGSIYVGDEELEKQMYSLAEELELGLYAELEAEEVEDEDWQPQGHFVLRSDTF